MKELPRTQTNVIRVSKLISGWFSHKTGQVGVPILKHDAAVKDAMVTTREKVNCTKQQ